MDADDPFARSVDKVRASLDRDNLKIAEPSGDRYTDGLAVPGELQINQRGANL